MSAESFSYGDAIREGFDYLLTRYPEVFAIGQGLWSPWYVGNTMTGLDKKFGTERIIDTPVSEAATTGVAIGASLCGYRPIVIHPRIDFMILGTDQIVNQAAKWSYMLGGQAHPAVTIRGIINRGGEQGAQHSQALHSWFAHIPGLRVVMPATAIDARDLLIASVLCDDPVLYIDDRWLYEAISLTTPIKEKPLSSFEPMVLKQGKDITLVGSGFSTQICLDAAKKLEETGFSAEVVDLRVLNPLKYDQIINSVEKTKRLLVVDGGWSTCGMAGEVLAGVVERIPPGLLKSKPKRLTLPDAPAPTSKFLEQAYYPTFNDVVELSKKILTD